MNFPSVIRRPAPARDGPHGRSGTWRSDSSRFPPPYSARGRIHKLGLPENLFSETTHQEKVSWVINRVFFRQSDACVVTRGAFEIAAELNPQVGKELQVLATSPEVVPTIFFFRAGFSPALRKAIEEAVLAVHETAAGKQAMTVFQCEHLEKHPLSCLDTARALVAEQWRLRGSAQEKGGVAAIRGATNP